MYLQGNVLRLIMLSSGIGSSLQVPIVGYPRMRCFRVVAIPLYPCRRLGLYLLLNCVVEEPHVEMRGGEMTRGGGLGFSSGIGSSLQVPKMTAHLDHMSHCKTVLLTTSNSSIELTVLLGS